MQEFTKQKYVKCNLCQAEILVIPDIKAMDKAIHNHIKEHRLRNTKKAKLLNNLTQQLLLAALETNAEYFANMPKHAFLLIQSFTGYRRILGVALLEHDAENWVTQKEHEEPTGSFYTDPIDLV